MAETGVEVIMTPRDLIQRFGRYPQKFGAVMKKTMEASLLHTQSRVPAYPRPLPNQRYIRTGTLGRSLGASQSGSPMGRASIHTVRRLGAAYEGAFGSSLSYAPEVIGEGTQKPIHSGRWWTMKTVATRATAGIIRLHKTAMQELANWIDGR